jgi:peptidoglycan/xylan/chitin deacetylase (PgdA/CDA1 family)
MDIMVLCYHAVSPTWTATLAVTPNALERQLNWLTRRGWRGATFSDALLAPTAERTLAVTFDDAFASVLELAHPILASLGLPATVFAPTAFAESGMPLQWPGIDHWAQTPSAPELACLTWDGLGQLAQAGWEIGSHTRTHPHLTSLDAAALSAELTESRAEVSERLGSKCVSIAYPYGDVDHRVAEAAEAAGYTVGASMSSYLERLGVLRWPRVGIYHVDGIGRFGLKTTRGMRWLRASPLWPHDFVT